MKDRENLDIRKRSIFSSSAESLESFDDSLSITTQEQLYDNIRLHKEIIQSCKLQPWSLSKKYKIVQKAKQYVAKHEDTLQERFAQSRNTKDLYARFKIVLADKFKYVKREFFNFCALLIPWEIRIKEIESRFGSVVASYFIFLRWLFWVNIVIANIFILFVIVPEVMISNQSKTNKKSDDYYERKVMLSEEEATASNFFTIWDFEGHLKYSPLFYGYYSKEQEGPGYSLPIAYFLAGVVVYIYSFSAILRKMAENSRISKLGSKEDECIFSWKLFTGWDYMIGHSETAANRIASVNLGFKEALLEEAEKQKDKKNWKIIVLRIFANINVILLLSLSVYAVIDVVRRSENPLEDPDRDTWWRRNEITIVLSLISFVFPMLFEILGLMEYYHPRMQLRLQLARIMILNLLNLYSLILALIGKINRMMEKMTDIHEKMGIKTSTTPKSVQSSTTEATTIYNSSISSSTTESILTDILHTNITESFDRNSTEYPEYDGEYYEDSASTTVKSITDILFSNITEILNQTFTTKLPINETTEDYSYGNPNYFEDEGTALLDDVFTTTEIITNSTTGLFSNFVTPDFSEYYYNDVNETLNSTVYDIPNSNIHYSFLQQQEIPVYNLKDLDLGDQLRLRKLCWETMFGQELVKLTVMDLLLTVMQILMFDFFRALFVRYMNSCWCWDLEKRFPKYGDFKIAENILHLVNNQGMVWMGMFFSPGLAIINLVKLILIMYLRSWAVITCNVPHEVIFRASRSNNFYLALLLTMLFLCVLPVSYAIVWIEPSHHCGPFSGNKRMYHLFTKFIEKLLPGETSHKFLEYIVSPAAIIPLLLLLILFIYYLISLTGALREANQDLKMQLHKERTEERKKMMKLMEDKMIEVNAANRLSARWKKVLDISKPNVVQPTITAATDDTDHRKKMLLARAMKNILRKKYSNDDDGIPKITTELAEP